jgi:hypothetical protein
MNRLLLTALAVLICFQFIKAQTTLEEYTFITHGLIKHFNEGADMKAGYTLNPLLNEAKIEWGNNKEWRTATLYYFTKTSTRKNVAIVVEQKDSYGNRDYKCIPTSDAGEEIWNKVFQDLKNSGEEWHIVFMWALTKLSSQKLLQ